MHQKIIQGILIILALSFAVPAGAAGEFTADYDVDYAISPNGKTIVTQNVTLTNKLTNLYPKQYTISLDTTEIDNVIAYDDGGVIKPEIKQNDSKTEIVLDFSQKIVGLGKKSKFSLRFENNTIAQKNGTIWEVNIPGITPDPDIGEYSVSLQIPPNFGTNAYLVPLPSNGRRWTKDQMTSGGISASYGTEQTFEVILTYYLENLLVNNRQIQIALPPDTSYQRVLINSLEPKPVNINKDEDGNWLALYELTPRQKLEVTAHLSISIYLKSRDDYPLSNVSTDVYVAKQRYWEVDNPLIINLARLYPTPRSIYTFVKDKLKYDYARIKQVPLRKGALGALNNPDSAVCMEFTDLFIAIARAAGIPAREAIGFAYTTNSKLRPLSLASDVLHSWPEYYDREKNLWIPVDPTWANTTGGVNYFDKLDFNHIVFAYHGISSEYPYPAGFYKRKDQQSKDVTVNFAQTTTRFAQGKVNLKFDFPKSVLSGTTAKGQLLIENQTNQSVTILQAEILASPVNFYLEKKGFNLPPYAKIFLPIEIKVENLFLSGRAKLVANVNGETVQYFFEVRPIYYLGLIICFFVLVLLLGIYLLIFRPKIRLWR